MPPKNVCQCADPGCPVHKGVSHCTTAAAVTLIRVDMQDRTGTMMCRACADDALESGLFQEDVGAHIRNTTRQ